MGRAATGPRGRWTEPAERRCFSLTSVSFVKAVPQCVVLAGLNVFVCEELCFCSFVCFVLHYLEHFSFPFPFQVYHKAYTQPAIHSI